MAIDSPRGTIQDTIAQQRAAARILQAARPMHLALGMFLGVPLFDIRIASTQLTARVGATLLTAAWTVVVIAHDTAYPRIRPSGSHWAA